MAYLTIVSGAMAGQQFQLDKPVTRIGRRDGNDWTIQDGSVSGTHCEIEKTKTGFLLRDLGSTNGTKVNGETVKLSGLYKNDIIIVGDVSMSIDGDDVPQNRTGDTQNISRTTIIIPDQPSKQAPPEAFGKKANSNKAWIAIIAFLLVVIIVLLVMFLRGKWISLT
ncbi:MAG: FHA domain-containing protein [Kiritimatiellaeota bacterium]|nr:FHA domain-containing protein [Kiritimatiellota bacterium]